MYTFATAVSRRYIFNAFWISHQLFYVLYLLTFLHGASRIIQEPSFIYYFIGPAVIFLFDKVISLSRKKKELSVVNTELLPSGQLVIL
jgi:dual oxidase